MPLIVGMYGTITIGAMSLAPIVAADEAEDRLRSDFAATQQKEREFVESISKKYGDGNLDLNTGVFTPRVTEETPDKTL